MESIHISCEFPPGIVMPCISFPLRNVKVKFRSVFSCGDLTKSEETRKDDPIRILQFIVITTGFPRPMGDADFRRRPRSARRGATQEQTGSYRDRASPKEFSINSAEETTAIPSSWKRLASLVSTRRVTSWG